MTSSVVVFIFVIQQVWQHIDKLVGKGLDTIIILEFLFYIILTIIPQAIPLGILLASLMVFGNMGEKLELLAIKASGVSLLRIMTPLIILVSCITIMSFFYQDRLVPTFRVKLQSLFSSIKQKNPEIAIPEGSFYNEISGFSIYVKKKNHDTRMLYEVVIYDLSGGFKNISVDYCDSAFMETAPSKDYLILTLYNGERFANVNNASTPKKDAEFIANMRDRYDKKTINIQFNSGLDRVEENTYEDTYISKNINQLRVSVDSLTIRLDSLNQLDRTAVSAIPIFKKVFSGSNVAPAIQEVKRITTDGNEIEETLIAENIESEIEEPQIPPMNFDSILSTYSKQQQSEIISSALNQSRSARISNLVYTHIDDQKPFLQRNIRMHEYYILYVYALSSCCLIFFFIGASLGAIIGKGGMGVPVILCVFFYIVYYMLQNVGRKLAQDGVWEVWQGIWLSSAILTPIAIFFTYKSMRESALFNTEAYNMIFRRLYGVKSDATRRETREPLYEEITPMSELKVNESVVLSLSSQDDKSLKDVILNYKSYYQSEEEGREHQLVALALLRERNSYLFDVRVNNYDYSYSKQILHWISSYVTKVLTPVFLVTILSFIAMIPFDLSIFIPLVFLAIYLILLIRVCYYLGDLMRSINRKNKNILVMISQLYFPTMEKIGSFFLGLLQIIFIPISYIWIGKKLTQIINSIKGKLF